MRNCHLAVVAVGGVGDSHDLDSHPVHLRRRRKPVLLSPPDAWIRCYVSRFIIRLIPVGNVCALSAINRFRLAKQLASVVVVSGDREAGWGVAVVVDRRKKYWGAAEFLQPKVPEMVNGCPFVHLVSSNYDVLVRSQRRCKTLLREPIYDREEPCR